MSLGSRFIALWIGATFLAIPMSGLAADPDPASYPALSAKQMGHVRHMINLANQLDGDFSLMGEMDPVYYMSFHAYQFQIAFAAYALASAHYHYTPAHRDLYQDASARLIKRMIYKDVWDYWAHTSKFDLTDRTQTERAVIGPTPAPDLSLKLTSAAVRLDDVEAHKGVVAVSLCVVHTVKGKRSCGLRR